MDFNPEILYRYFTGVYSRNDYKKIKSVLENEPYHPALKKHLEDHWEIYFEEPQSAIRVDHLLRKIHRQIENEERAKQKMTFIGAFQRVAAILIIPLALAFFTIFYFHNIDSSEKLAYAEIQCPLGVRTKFELPDGSTGFLNSGSTLRFPASFSGQRTVAVSGEAFFNVAHNEQYPFIVETKHLKIRVLGTEFNVVAYADDTQEEVILNKGKVDILSSNGELFCSLRPDQSVVFDPLSYTVQKRDVEAQQYIGWTEGKLIFRHENMKQVAERLGRWYNAEIVIEDTEILDYVFRATFIDEPLDEVLKLLTLTAPITFEEQMRETTNDNTYKKRKIILKLDKKKQAAFK